MISETIRTALLNHLSGNATYTPPAAFQIALSTTDPGADGLSISEPGNGYARVSVSSWTVAAGEMFNSSPVSFPLATGSWGNVTHFTLWDDLTFVGAAPLNQSRSPESGDNPTFAAGQLRVKIL